MPLPYNGRTGHIYPTVLGLSLQRTHEGITFHCEPFASVREVALEVLREDPTLMAREVREMVRAATGQSLSDATISRLRSSLNCGS